MAINVEVNLWCCWELIDSLLLYCYTCISLMISMIIIYTRDCNYNPSTKRDGK